MRRGQAAVEYLILIGFVLLASSPMFVQVQQSSLQIEDATNQLRAQDALDTMGEAAGLVHSQGEPARVTFEANFPSSIESVNVTRNYIRMRVRGEDYIEFVEFNVTGDLPMSQGYHTLVAEAVGRTNVSIHEK